MPTVRLTWQEGNPSEAGEGFKIYRSANGGQWQLMVTLPLSTTQWDDTSVSYGNFYRYRVVEYLSVDESTPAEVAVSLYQCTDTPSVSDAARRGTATTRAETQSQFDTLRRAPLRLLAEAAEATFSLRRAPGSQRTVSQSTADGDFSGLLRILADWMDQADAAQRGLARELAEETLPPGDEVQKSHLRLHHVLQSSSDAWTRTWAATLSLLEWPGALAEWARLWSVVRAWEEGQESTWEVARGPGKGAWEEVGVAEFWPRGLARFLAEGATLADGVARGTFRRLYGEGDVWDGDYRAVWRPLWLWEPGGDVHGRHPEKRATEGAWAEDAGERGVAWVRSWGEAVGVEYGRSSWVGRALSDGGEAGDSWVRAVEALRAEGQASSGELVRVLWRLLEEAGIANDGDRQGLLRFLTEVAAATVALARAPGKRLGEELEAAEKLWRALFKGIFEAAELRDGRRRALDRGLRDEIWSDDLAGRSLEWRRNFLEPHRSAAGIVVPGGANLYPWDFPPLDAKVILVGLKKLLRLEDI